MMYLRGRRAAVALLAVAAAISFGVDRAVPSSAAPDPGGWVSAWTAAPQPGNTYIPGLPTAAPLQNQTLRLIVHPETGGGSALRIHLSNVFGDRPLVIGAASIARQTSDADVDAASARPVTFGGSNTVTIANGTESVSDPIPYNLPDGADLAVDLFLPEQTGVPTWHLEAKQTSYISTDGNHVGTASLPVGSSMTSWDFLTGLDVLKPTTKGLIAFGDSITDGTGSSLDANHRYPDYLATNLAGKNIAVVDAGIGGGRLLNDIIGPSGLSRFQRDVLSQSSATYVLVCIGINDIGFPGAANDPAQAVTADQITQGYQQLITQAHAAKLTIYAGTITPAGGSIYNTPGDEQERQAVNSWLLSNAGKAGGFDKVVDFDAVIHDPANPSQILPAYDSGDHIHLNDAGYAAMAKAAAASVG